MIQMALVRFLAEMTCGEGVGSGRCTLLLIDEPELYLHPQAIEQVRGSLKELTKHGYQVIFSTHSPVLIARDDLPQVNLIFKRAPAWQTTVNLRAREAVLTALAGNSAAQARTLFELGTAKEVLFCDHVLLVEGHTEVEVLPALFEAVMGASLGAHQLGLVRLAGCGDMRKAMRILADMNIRACGVVDLDYGFTGGVRAKFIPPDHVHVQTAKTWFQANHGTHNIELGSEGFPMNCNDCSAEQAFRHLATDPANKGCIDQLHAELRREHRIWLWKNGSIEHVLGLSSKNDHEMHSELRRNLADKKSSVHTTLKKNVECEAFCHWLRGGATI